jgi:uncharacterized repeat protein (TIGR04076 family)
MPRRKSYNVAVKVISQKGTCDAGHKVGDEWLLSSKTPEGICLTAFHALFPNARVLMFGGAFPWYRERIAIVACPDAKNPVVFELRPVEK